MHSHQHALEAGFPVPENGEGVAADTAHALWDQENSNSSNSAVSAVTAQALDAKQFATLQARAAIAGFELVRMADATFVVARWGLVRPLVDVGAVESFLAQVGAR